MRIFLQFILPLLLPGLLYIAWTYLTQARSEDGGPARAVIAEGPWFRLLLAGFVLMIIGLATAAMLGGTSPEGEYRAPYLQDGKVVPGGMVKDP